jgi:hypothetical protein
MQISKVPIISGYGELNTIKIVSVTTAFLGAKQEGLAIVNFLNKLIVSCKEAVRIPIFWG